MRSRTKKPQYYAASGSDLAALPLAGRRFLHCQGLSFCRGFVDAFRSLEDGWELDVRAIEYRNRQTGLWELKTERDEYCARIGHFSYYYWLNGVIEINGYGLKTFIADSSESDWSDVHWPMIGPHDGGPIR